MLTMKKWILLSVAVLTVMALGLAACGSPAPTTAPPPPTYTPYPTYTPAPVPTQPPAPTGQPTYTPYPTYTPVPLPTATPVPGTPTPTPKPEVLKVGLNSILSGSGAAWGIAHDRSAQMAADEIAAAGGIKVGNKTYVFQFVEDDNKYTADGGTTVANKQVFQDKVQYMIAVGTTPILSSLPIVEPNKVLFFAGSYVSQALGKQWTYSFRVSMGTEQFSPVIWNYARTQYPDIHKISYLNVNNSTGWGVRTSDEAAMKAEGGFQFVADILYEAGTADFSPFVTKLLAAKPDMVCTGAAGPGDQALIIEGLRDQGYKGKIITATGFDFDTVTNLIPKSSLTGLITAIPQWDDQQVPVVFRDYYFAYLKKFGSPFNIIGQMGYDGVRALAAGLTAAGSTDPTAVRDAMDKPGFSFIGAFGKSSYGGKEIYGINHQVYYAVWGCEYENGRSVIKKTVQGPDALALQIKAMPFLPTPTPAK